MTVTVATLRTEIENIIQDASWDDDDILGFLNDGVNELAEELLLRDLFTNDTVTTSTSSGSVSLPSDFHKKLVKVFSSSQEQELTIVESFTEFMEEYGYSMIDDEDSGDVQLVCPMGSSLYYQPIPSSADTLTLYYYRTPTQMSADSDTPDGIPCYYKSPVLVPYVCAKVFEQLEDGIEGRKVNTEYFTTKFERAKSKLISRNAMFDQIKKKGFSA